MKVVDYKSNMMCINEFIYIHVHMILYKQITKKIM